MHGIFAAFLLMGSAAHAMEAPLNERLNCAALLADLNLQAVERPDQILAQKIEALMARLQRLSKEPVALTSADFSDLQDFSEQLTSGLQIFHNFFATLEARHQRLQQEQYLALGGSPVDETTPLSKQARAALGLTKQSSDFLKEQGIDPHRRSPERLQEISRLLEIYPGILASYAEVLGSLQELSQDFYLRALMNPNPVVQMNLIKNLALGPLIPNRRLSQILLEHFWKSIGDKEFQKKMLENNFRLRALHPFENHELGDLLLEQIKSSSDPQVILRHADLYQALAFAKGSKLKPFPFSQRKEFFMLFHQDPARLRAMKFYDPDEMMVEIILAKLEAGTSPQALEFLCRWPTTPTTQRYAGLIRDVLVQAFQKVKSYYPEGDPMFRYKELSAVLVERFPDHAFELIQGRLAEIPKVYAQQMGGLLLEAAIYSKRQSNWQEALVYVLGDLESLKDLSNFKDLVFDERLENLFRTHRGVELSQWALHLLRNSDLPQEWFENLFLLKRALQHLLSQNLLEDTKLLKKVLNEIEEWEDMQQSYPPYSSSS